MNTYTIWADDGEYTAQGASIEEALMQFHADHPGRYVAAVVDDAMRPRLVLEDQA